MAQEIIGAKIQLDTTDVKSFKAQLREANNDLVKMSEAFGASSNQAIGAAKKVAKLRDAIGDAKNLVDQFNPDQKFRALTTIVSGAASGFTSLQGAMGLFGGESEDVAKALIKVQSAMAFSQGINQLGDLRDGFKNAAIVIRTQVVTAFSTLKGAIISTGIGALVVGLGLLIANFAKVKEVVLNLVPGLATVGAFFGRLIDKVTDFVGVTSQASRSMDKFTKDTNKSIKDQERFLDLNADKYDEYTQKKLRANIEYKKKQVELNKDETLSDAEKRQALLDNTLKYNRSIDDADKSRNDAYKKQLDAKNKIDSDAAKKAEKDRFDREEARRKKEFDDFQMRLKGAEFLTAQAKAEKEKKNKEEKDFLDAEAKKMADEDAAEYLRVQEQIKNANILSDLKTKLRKEELDADIALQNAKFAAASAGIGLLASLVGENKALADTLFAIDKGLAIAKIIVDTQREIAGYYASAAALGPIGAALATKLSIGAKIRAGIGIATIAATTVSKFSGGGSGSIGGTTPSISPGISPLQPTTISGSQVTLDQRSIDAIGNRAIKAYVVESDITNSQKKIRRIEMQTRFG